MARARIVLISGFRYPWATETHLAQDAERIGCEVKCINERIPNLNRYVLERECDLVLYMKAGHPLALRETQRLWAELAERGVRTASYHLDLYVGLKRQNEIDVHPFWRTRDVFTADGDPRSAAYFKEHGVNHHWLPAAIVSDECQHGAYDPTLAADVVFVGKVDLYHPEWPWRQKMVEALREHYGKRFVVHTHRPKPIRGQRLNDLYASAKVVVGDTLALPGHRDYWSDRPYETVGRGGFLVFPDVPGIEKHFERGVHYAGFEPGNLDEMFERIDFYLHYGADARQIAEQGRAHVAREHTYRQRMNTLLETVGL